jgi:hypothetical protein
MELRNNGGVEIDYGAELYKGVFYGALLSLNRMETIC